MILDLGRDFLNVAEYTGIFCSNGAHLIMTFHWSKPDKSMFPSSRPIETAMCSGVSSICVNRNFIIERHHRDSMYDHFSYVIKLFI